MSGKKEPQSGTGDLAKAMRQSQPYVDASWQLVGSVLLCSFVGWWLDGRFGTKPWLLVAGAAFGMVCGMYVFIRRVLDLAEIEKKLKEKQDGKEGP